MKRNLRVRYHILKTIVELLGLLEYLAMGYGLISFYTKDSRSWQLAIIILAISYLTSYELGYYVNRLQIRIELERGKANAKRK